MKADASDRPCAVNKGQWSPINSEKVISLNSFGTLQTGKLIKLDDDHSIGHLVTRSSVGCWNRR